MTADEPPASAPGTGVLIALTAASVLILIGAVALLVFAVARTGDDSKSAITASEPGESSPGSQPSSGDGAVQEDTSARGSTTVVAPTTAPNVALAPSTATATNTRKAVPELKCTGLPLAYTADQLIDGDPETGWGASEGDGSGEHATISFGRQVNLTSVGIIPGYAREAEHSKADCNRVSAFEYNRQIQAVRWTFDDGSSLEQTFEPDPSMQTLDVSKTTGSVTLEILRTVRPDGADSDTIISEAAFEGTG